MPPMVEISEPLDETFFFFLEAQVTDVTFKLNHDTLIGKQGHPPICFTCHPSSKYPLSNLVVLSP